MTPRVDVHGLRAAEATRLRAAARVGAALDGRAPRASRARVVFVDDNGPKGGPAMRCAVTVSVPRRGRMHVEACGITARLALDGALDRLARRLARTAAVTRDLRRRPKKYYAARALAG